MAAISEYISVKNRNVAISRTAQVGQSFYRKYVSWLHELGGGEGGEG